VDEPLVLLLPELPALTPQALAVTGADEQQPVRLTAWVHGSVQGVGFRWWTRSRALELGLVGWAKNLADGRVEIVAEGTREQCDRLVTALRSVRAPGRVSAVSAQDYVPARGGVEGFTER
jgi:acylphosphatase